MDLPAKERAANAMKRAAPWLGALAGHAALALTVGVARLEGAATPEPEPPALIVTLLEDVPKPPPPSPRPEASAEAQETEELAPAFDFASHIARAQAPAFDELEVLSSPDSKVATTALPPAIRWALAQARACAAAAQAATADDQPAPCPPIPEQFAQWTPSGGAFLDATVLEQHGAAAAWTTVTTFVASRVLSMTEGITIPETTWGANARVNPLLVDQSIFDVENGEITITSPTDTP